MNHVFNNIPPYRCIGCGKCSQFLTTDTCTGMLKDVPETTVNLDTIPDILFEIIQFYALVHNNENPELQTKILERIVSDKQVIKHTSGKILDIFSYLAGVVVETSDQIASEKADGERNRMAC